MLLVGGAANAATIDYLFTGTCGTMNGACSLHGTSFTSFTVTEVGNTTAVTESGGEFSNSTTGTFVSGALTATLTGTTNSVIDNPASPGFLTFDQFVISPFTVNSEGLFDNPVFETYQLATALSSTTGTLSTGADAFFVTGDTIAGTLIFDDIMALSFQATIPSAVPEPASLAILGTALAGFGLIRRRRKQV